MYSEYTVGKKNSKFIRAIMCLESEGAPDKPFFAPAIKRCGVVLSLKSNVLITTDKEEYSPPKWTIKGVFETPYFYSYLGKDVLTFGIDLQITGLYEMTQKSGIHYKNQYLKLADEFDTNEILELTNDLKDESLSLSARAHIFDLFLESKFPDKMSEKSVIVDQVDKLGKESFYKMSLDEIADEMVLSRKTIERAFKEVVGLSPKQYFSISIFEDMVRNYSLERKNEIPDFLDSPFYDFSHINKWFKKFAHTSPREFVNLDMQAVGEILQSRR